MEGREEHTVAVKRAHLSESPREPTAIPTYAGGDVRLCTRVARGLECPHGDGCTFSHDLPGYLASKPPDLPDACPNVPCQYGHRCRYAASHLAAHLESAEGGGRRPVLDDLRKRRVPFPLSDAHLSGSSGDAVGAEPAPADFRDRLYLAPLTTVGNWPFRRLCRRLGADVTCSEMAMATNLLRGQAHEWALLQSDSADGGWGIQLAGGWTDSVARATELVVQECRPAFVDLNCGCPTDAVYGRGMGAGLLGRGRRLEEIVRGMRAVSRGLPITVKMRTGIGDGKPVAHDLIARMARLGVSAVTVHGRSREQRCTRAADWSYIAQCVRAVREQQEADPTSPARRMAVVGNGDVFSYADYVRCRDESGVDSVMVARAALIKPWLFTELREARVWDIAARERFDLLRSFVHDGLRCFGSDGAGVERTRGFLLEWLSFLHRYVPVGLLEDVQRMNQRVPRGLQGRDELETLLASPAVEDWVLLSTRLLGPVPAGQASFVPRHRAVSHG